MARGGSKPGFRTEKTSNASASVSKRAGKDGSAPPACNLPLELQQRCLNIFRDALGSEFEDNAILQEVKGHLFNRDFASAFGKEEYLRVYASRWSPSRALAYLQVLHDIDSHLERVSDQHGVNDAQNEPCRVVCIGGGAGGELLAFASWLSAQRSRPSQECVGAIHIDLVDIADWSKIVHQLSNGLVRPPVLSKYASQAKKDANTALLQLGELAVDFHHKDVIETDSCAQADMKELLARADLATFMFTLNELYSTSIPKTQDLLAQATRSMRPGSHLLVVDSPGSYSTLSLNDTEKQYPMHWLLDYTLLGREGEQFKGKWKKLESDQSRWYRLPDGLQYPIDLENMRYQIHLYRRLSDVGG